MNSNEAPQNREADRASPVLPEGHVIEGSDRPGCPGRSLDRFRLKRSVDCFLTEDGCLQILHDGLEQQYEVARPDRRDILILDLLRAGFVSEREISDRLRREGIDPETVPQALTDLEGIGVLERDRGRDLLSEQDAERFDRQLIYLADICPEGESAWQLQHRLRSSHVVVLGCGGLGSWAATGLALAGIGRLTLVDDDTVELSNLNRQLLFRSSDLGRPKVEAARESLAALDPELEVNLLQRRIETIAEVEELVAEADLLVMTADHPPYELARTVNRACHDAGTAWISAGQIPPLIRVGPIVIPGHSPCLTCQENAFRRQYPQYDELVRHRRRKPADAATLGPASGAIGSTIAMEAVHYLTGAVKPATLGQAMLLDLRTLQSEFEPVEFDSACDCREILPVVGTSLIG